MNKYTVMCVDDEREVLDSVVQDLEILSSMFDIESVESASEAKTVLEEMEQENRRLALILCDHMMPDILGVDFLIELNDIDTTKAARKLLLTGQAGHEATIEAINRGGLDYYIAKPWTSKGLLTVVIDQLTTFIVENEDEPVAYANVLDEVKIFEAIHARGF